MPKLKRALPYRPNVCMLLYNQKGRLFLGERAGSPGIWQFPQGGVDRRMSLAANVKRELAEELGISKETLGTIHRLKARHRYDFRKPPPYARGKWRGQAQTFWIVEFIGRDRDIRLDRGEPEFMDWKWCTPAQVRRVAEPIRSIGYRRPLKEFEMHMKRRVAARKRRT
jgi:putative (di)nucleoside polyphosphate hydrolase